LLSLLRDAAPGEDRWALVEAEHVVELHVRRDGQAIAGETGTARLTSTGAGGNFLIDENDSTILLRNRVSVPEGSAIPYRITRSAIAEPGHIKSAEAVLLEPDAPSMSRDAAWQASIAHGRDDLNFDTPKPANLSHLFDPILVGAVQSGPMEKNGAMISFERTKAGLIFDVDGTGNAVAINCAAATEIARLLRLYQVGGSVLIDFISMANKGERLAVGEAFDAASVTDPRPYERTAINGFGLLQIVRPRPRPSVIDMIFGTEINQPSVETQGLWLIRNAAQSSGIGPRSIMAATKVATWLQHRNRTGILDQATKIIGAPISIIADPSISGYGHVHVNQR
jgi:ribonuclease G